MRLRADTYTIALMRHGVNGINADIAWLDELVSAERTRIAEERGDGHDTPADPARSGEPPHDTPDPTSSLIHRQEPQA